MLEEQWVCVCAGSSESLCQKVTLNCFPLAFVLQMVSGQPIMWVWGNDVGELILGVVNYSCPGN